MYQFGKPFIADRAFKCSACQNNVSAGEAILFDFTSRKRFHFECGQKLTGDAPANDEAGISGISGKCNCSERLDKLQADIDSLHEILERIRSRVSWVS